MEQKRKQEEEERKKREEEERVMQVCVCLCTLPLCIDPSPPPTPSANQMPTPSHAGMFRTCQYQLFCRHNHALYWAATVGCGFIHQYLLTSWGWIMLCLLSESLTSPSPPMVSVYGAWLTDFPCAVPSRWIALQWCFVPVLSESCSMLLLMWD